MPNPPEANKASLPDDSLPAQLGLSEEEMNLASEIVRQALKRECISPQYMLDTMRIILTSGNHVEAVLNEIHEWHTLTLQGVALRALAAGKQGASAKGASTEGAPCGE